MESGVRLGTFDNRWYKPGRSFGWQVAWFFVGLPLLRCAILPSSRFRAVLLGLFGGKIGANVTIKPGVRVKYPWRLRVGDDCWIGEDCWIDNLADVELENNVCISQGAYLCTGNHDWTDPAFGLRLGEIRLEDGCWVGARALIAPGVTMGAGSIAAAGSVIHGNIGEYEIHAGNPAVFVRFREIKNEAEPLRVRAATNSA